MKPFSSRKIASYAVLTTVALVLFLFETLLPRPLPWAKPGLANAVTLLALYLLDLPAALLIVTLRVILGNLVLGTLFSPVVLLSLGGGVSAALVMGVVVRVQSRLFSPIGISVLGSITHNIIQLTLASWILVQSSRLWVLLPWMTFSAVLTGMLIGIVVSLLLRRLGTLNPEKGRGRFYD